MPSSIVPAGLRCEYAANPLGIDTDRPRLSWTFKDPEEGVRNAHQSAYEILVASRLDLINQNKGDLWASGKVPSSENVNVEYAGSPLRSRQRAWWKVRVWDEQGCASEFSAPAWWETAMLDQAKWRARWIQSPVPLPEDPQQLFADHPAPMFRKAFHLNKSVARARAYVTGLGYYEFHLNGRKIGDVVLDPGWTLFDKTVLYSVYDVTRELRVGANAAGILLGNGWYNPLPLKMWGKINPREALPIGPPCALVQIHVTYEDGREDIIATDESWRAGESAIVRNNIYLGEVYDARRETPGWDTAEFDDAHWPQAKLYEGPGGALKAQYAEPIREIRTIRPVAVTEPQPDVYIVDMGENFSGSITFTVAGEAGTKIELRYGELLNPDGTLNGLTAVCGQIKREQAPEGTLEPATAWQADTYICKGGGAEQWSPRFTWHGFRYVEVKGWPGEPRLQDFTGHALASAVPNAGFFLCSNDLFNKIQDITTRTQLSNIFSVQSDCPHRERFGYGGDIVAAAESMLYNVNLSRFYTKAVEDLAESARPNGGLTETAPFVGISDGGLGDMSGPIGWGTAFPYVQWLLYQHYGDTRVLEQHYPAVQKWLDLLERSAQDGVIDIGIGDHESLVPKDLAVSGTAFYYYNALLASRIAEVLGRKADADKYAALADTVAQTFNRTQFDPATARYGLGNQASQAFALYMDLAPAEERGRVLDVLVEDVQANRLTTGIFGTKYMLRALSEMGRADVAYDIVNSRQFPGWGHMIDNGATTLWEHWEFSDNTYSHNHPMFGSVSEWFYADLAGIQAHPEAVAFDQIVIKPQPVAGLEWVNAVHRTVRGPVASKWRKVDGKFELNVKIPPNTTATVFVPAESVDEVTESGAAAKDAEGVLVSRWHSGCAVFTIGSGEYTFASPLHE